MAQNPANVIKSYLVGLGFDVDPAEFRQFEHALSDAKGMVSNSTAAIGLDLVKWQSGIMGLFATVSGAIVGTVDKVAMADQEYRLFGERMFMNTRQAREYKMALDALGQPIEAVAWDPELHERFKELIADQKRIEGMLGPNFEAQMKQIRDVRFEFTRTGVELQNLAMIFTSALFTKLGGSGDVLTDLRRANEWLLEHLPELANELSDEAIPILKDMWGMLKDLGEILKYTGTEFTNLVGIISGDDSLTKEKLTFHDFARAVEDVVHWLAEFVQIMFQVEKIGGAGVDFLVTGAHSLGLNLTQKQIDKDVDRQTKDGQDAWAAMKGIFHILGGNKSYDGGSSPAFLAGPAKGVANAVSAAGLSNLFGVDPQLIAAVADTESGNRQFDRSGNVITGPANPSGERALGRMQLLPSTAASLGFNPNDEKENISGGAKLLSQLFGKYGDWNLALEAYNWGPGHLDRALKSGGRIPTSVQQYASGILADYDKRKRGGAMGAMGGGGGSTTHVSIGTIQIMQPNATAEQIGSQVADKVHAKMGMQTQRNLVEANGVFG